MTSSVSYLSSLRLATPKQILETGKHLIITGLALSAISYLPTVVGGRCEDALIGCLNFCVRVSDFRASSLCLGGCQIWYVFCRQMCGE